MTRKVTIAAVQLPVLQDARTVATQYEQNLEMAEHWLNEAGRRGADIACVGEMFNIVGLDVTRESLPSLVADAHQQVIARAGAIARRHHMVIVAPIVASLHDALRNVTLVLDRDGTHIGSYIKVHCIENERNLGIVPGDAWPVFKLDFGTIGIQTCHDNSFPESARCLTLNGAEIIFWPHVMSGWGGEFMDILLRAPAIHNGVYHVPVCYGCDPARAWQPGMMIGRSSIIAPDATILADAGRYVGMALTSIDLDRPRIATGFTRTGDYVWGVDMRNDRRPDTYGALTRHHDPQEPIPADSVVSRSKEEHT